jgi:hypothetical protein
MPDALSGKNKQVYQVVNRFTGDSVADYSSKPRNVKRTKNIQGFRYEPLEHIIKTKNAILNEDTESFFSPYGEKRIKKTRSDLNRIKRAIGKSHG